MKYIIKKLSWFLKEEKKTYLLLMLLLIIIIVMALLPAYVLGLSIDYIVSGGITKESLFYLVGALTLIPITRYMTSFIYNYKASKLAQKQIGRVSCRERV